MVLSFATSLVLASIVHLKAYLAILWIVLLVFSFSVVPALVALFVPPRFEIARPLDCPIPPAEAWRRRLNLFLGLWFGGTFFLFGYMYVLGWIGVAVMGSTSISPEALEMFSLPLAWANTSFLIRADSAFVKVLGILFANTFFYAAILTALVTVVRNRMRKQEVLELGISGRIGRDDE